VNSFGFKRLAKNLNPNVKQLGVAIGSMYLTFKQDMMFRNVKEVLLRSQIYSLSALDVIYQWEVNTLSTNGVRKVK